MSIRPVKRLVRAKVWLGGLLALFGTMEGCGGRPSPENAKGSAGSRATAGAAAESRSAAETWTLANPPPLERPAGFPAADEASCAECHQEIVAAYAKHPMSRSWRAADREPPDGESLPPDEVVDVRSGYRYQIERAQGKLTIEESVLAPELRWGPGLRVAAEYRIGSGNHASALALRDGELLRLWPVAWFTAERRWRMSPGYEHQNVRFSRPITEACVACHSSDARLRPPTLNRYDGAVTGGIGCRRCHGPAQEHVARMRSAAGSPVGQDSIDLVNPTRLSAQRANDVCLQCHLQGIVSLHPAGRGPFTFRPGERLAEHRIDFLVDTDKPAAFGVASHGSRMMQSRCYTATGGKLTCIQCHEAHVPVAEHAPERFDLQCRNCHSHRERLPPDARHESGTGCAACHMPQRSTREGQHLVFTDHWIRRVPEPFEPTPSVLEQGVTLRPVATEDSGRGQNKLGAACVWLHEAIGPQQELLEKGIRLLEGLVRSGRGDGEDAYWLGAALFDAGRATDSVRVLERLLALEPDHHRARFRLALAYRRIGHLELADSALEACLAAAPHWTEPYEPLALAQLKAGRYADAASTLRAELQQHESATANIHLAVALLESSRDFSGAGQLLNRAAQLRPLDPAVELNLAYALTLKQDLRGSAIHYRRVLKLDPANTQALEAIERLDRELRPR